MKQRIPPSSVLGVHAPAPRLTLSALFLTALALSSAFLIIATGFTTAVAWLLPG